MKWIVSCHRLIASAWLAAALLLIAAAVVSAAVTLMSFTATPEGNDIVIRWQTGSELDAAGFIVIRSTDNASYDEYVGDFVPASGNASGASYAVTDTNVERGVTYYYILDSIDISNELTETGPISATLPLTSTNNTPTATSTATSSPTSTPTGTPTSTPTPTPTSTPTVTSIASNQPAQNGPATATRPPTNTPTPLSVGASTITPSAPRASTATATLRPAASATPAAATVASLPTARAASAGSGVQPVQTVGAPPAASSTQDQSPGSVEPSPTAGSLVAMEPMVVATPAAPVASTPTSGSGLNAFVIGLLVLAVLLVGAGLFAILRQTGR